VAAVNAAAAVEPEQPCSNPEHRHSGAHWHGTVTASSGERLRFTTTDLEQFAARLPRHWSHPTFDNGR
jgi:hypothetical protein